jgi:hypothetical protein
MSTAPHPLSTLALPDRARTAVASSHVATLGRATSSRMVRYVDDDGEPVVVLAHATPPPRGPVALTIRPAPAALGAVVLTGHLTPVDLEALGDDAARCLAGPEPCVHVRPADTLHRLVVDQVRVAGGECVRLPDYVEAEADLFAAFGDEVAQHLSDDHALEIGVLAARYLSPRPVTATADPGRVVGAAVRVVGRTALQVDLVDVDGSHPVTIPFSRRLDHLSDLGRELRALGAAL